MDVAAAFLRSGAMIRKVLLVSPPEARVSPGHLWGAPEAIYGLSDGPSAPYRTLGDFLRKNEVWGTQAGSTFTETAPDPCVYKIGRAYKREVSHVASGPGRMMGRRLRVWRPLMWMIFFP